MIDDFRLGGIGVGSGSPAQDIEAAQAGLNAVGTDILVCCRKCAEGQSLSRIIEKRGQRGRAYPILNALETPIR